MGRAEAGGDPLGPLIKQVRCMKNLSVGITLHLCASESMAVNKLKLSDCPTSYHSGPFLNHLQ